MALNPMIGNMFQYRNVTPGDTRTLADIWQAAEVRKTEEANRRIAEAMEARTAARFGKQFPIEANIADQTLASLNEQEPNIPPQYANLIQQRQPEISPQYGEREGPMQQPTPFMQPKELGPQPPPTPPDRYAPIEQGINREQELLNRKNKHLNIASYNPNNPYGFLAARDKGAQELETGKQDLDTRRMNLGMTRDWDTVLPKLDVIKNKAIEKMAGTGTYTQTDLINKMKSDVESYIAQNKPYLAQTPMYKTYIDDLGFHIPPQPSMASIVSAPPQKGAVESWAQQLANHEISVDQFAQNAANKIRGQNGEKFARDVFARVKEIDPSVNPANLDIGFKQAKNAINNRTLGLINSVRPNLEKLMSLSDKIDRSGVKAVSKAALLASRQFTSEDLANFDKLKTLSVDEINNIFAPGGGSNLSREMALQLIDETLPPAKFRSAMQTVIEAMDNRKAGLESLLRGYKGPELAEKSNGAATVAPIKEWKDGDTRINSAGTPMIRVNGKWQPQ
jgi:hypothetical protein